MDRRAAAIQPAVVPLLAGETRQTLSELRAQVAHAVAFLEGVTELRYYPVPTLLVDEFLVRSVRSAQGTVDRVPEPAGPGEEEVARARKEVAAWRDILSQAVLGIVDRVLASEGRADLAKNKGPKQLAVSFSMPTFSDPSEFDDRLAWEAVRGEPGWSGLREERREVRLSGPRAEDPEFRWDYKVHGDVAGFIRALEVARERLAARLPQLDSWDYTAADGPSEEARKVIGDAVAALLVISGLRDELSVNTRERWPDRYSAGDRIDDWVVDALYPSWRRARDWLHRQGVASMTPDLAFRAFLTEYFHVMGALLEYGNRSERGFSWQGSYPITQTAWGHVSGVVTDLQLTATDYAYTSRGEPHIRLSGPFSEYVILFTRGAEQLLAALAKLQHRSATPAGGADAARWVVEASTYGIFAPGNEGAEP